MSGIANDLTPFPPHELTAMERGMRAIDWVTARLRERGALSTEQRTAKAVLYDETAASYADAGKAVPAMLELAGLNSLAAKIMRAGE